MSDEETYVLEILRNLGRHKLRTGLTTFGIIIGIFALTVMGSMTEYFNTMLDNALKHGGSSIGVTANTREGAKPLSASTVRRLRRLPGVKEVVPIVIDSLEAMESGVQFGPPDMVYALPPELSAADFVPLTLRAGRWLQRGDTYQTVIGHKIAHKRNLILGESIEWREETFTVVGIEGKAIVLSTHMMNQVERLCDRILLINEGKRVLYGPLEEIKARYAQHALLIRSPRPLADLPGAKRVERRGQEQFIVLEEAISPQDILRELVERGIPLTHFEVATPPLEDIFIRVVEGGDA